MWDIETNLGQRNVIPKMELVVWKVVHLGWDKGMRIIATSILDLILHGVQHLALLRLIKRLLMRHPTTLFIVDVYGSLLVLVSTLSVDLDLFKRFLVRVIIE